MTPPRTPQATALLDQLDAASAHAVGILTAVGESVGGWISHREPTPPVHTVLRKLAVRILAGDLGWCRHLNPAAPAPVFWTPWAPGKLRCAGCLARAGTRVKGTPEDRRCDGCSRIRGAVYPAAVALPASLADLPGQLVYWPPITATFVLCATCKSAPPEPTEDRSTA